MRIYLGLGSNLGDRRSNLSRALQLLAERGISIRRVSPVVESGALLPADAPVGWDRSFLNLAAECETREAPETVHGWVKEIEQHLGRTPGPRWSPRTIDIDILIWGDERITTDRLTIPHIGLTERNFVLTPLVALQPRLVPPGSDVTLLESSRRLRPHIPLWMGIVNVTPDSFSDGGRFLTWADVEPHVTAMIDAGVHVIDVGGESTRPRGAAITAETEWARVGPVLERLVEIRARYPLGPSISIDTYRAETARRAVEMGVDMINDVGGLGAPEMMELAGESGTDFAAMHQLSLPVDPTVTLPRDADPYVAVEHWLLERLEAWDKAGLDLNRIIFDPGIGFGKTARQSMELLRRAGEFRQHGLRVLVGHSRKSFLRPIVGEDMRDRDLATVGLSMELCDQGLDMLRVHDVPMNIDGFRARAHGPPRSPLGQRPATADGPRSP